ncbi:MAG: hypothetical protein II532_05110 [Bacteroidales bacterium]|nr:hypothetical protein [Bacteroidales bacterium]
MNNKQFFESLGQQHVMIVGDVMIDAYMWGDVTRISPEAPVPIVSITRREQRLGGAANVALNIHSMGAKPIICSVLGNDDHNKEFQKIMYGYDMDKRGIITSDVRRTTVKSRVIGNKMHIVRVDEEDTMPLNNNDEEALLDRVRRILKQVPVSAIIFQDYDKGVITPHVIDAVTEMARKKNIITTVDPKHRNFSHYHDVTLFKPNLKELREGLNIEIDDSSVESLRHDLGRAAQIIHDQQHVEIVLITLGDKGVFLCDFRGSEPQMLILPAQLRSVADVSGAGDTVISVATLALAAGLPVEQVGNLANHAGGIVCEQVGVVPIDCQRLQEETANE